MSQVAQDYESMSVQELNDLNDDYDRRLAELRDERARLNEVRKRKAHEENLDARLGAAGHDVENMSYEDKVGVRDRIRDVRTKRRKEMNLGDADSSDARDDRILEEAGHDVSKLSRQQRVDLLYSIKTGTTLEPEIVEKGVAAVSGR
jgi:hypothetical protein